jgi:hypothetical protein
LHGLLEPRELGGQRRHLVRARRGDVVRLRRVLPEVEELAVAVRAADQHPGVAVHGVLRAVVEARERAHQIGVAGGERHRRERPLRRQERRALHARRALEVERVDERRHHVGQVHDVGHAAGGRARHAQDQGHVHLARVDAVRVSQHLVLAEALAVVADEQHDRVLEEAARLELGEQVRELPVQVADARVVHVDQAGALGGQDRPLPAADRGRVDGHRPLGGGELLHVAERRDARLVRVHVVEEQEEAAVAPRREPLEREPVHLWPEEVVALVRVDDAREAPEAVEAQAEAERQPDRPLVGPRADGVDVRAEALVEPEHAVQVRAIGTDRPGLHARLRGELRERHGGRRERPHARRVVEAAELREAHALPVVDDVRAVRAREESREEGRVRRQRPARRADRVLEQHGLRGEAVEPRRRRPPVAVGAEVVRAHRVEHDDEEVRVAGVGGRPRPGGGRAEHRASRQLRRDGPRQEHDAGDGESQRRERRGPRAQRPHHDEQEDDGRDAEHDGELAAAAPTDEAQPEHRQGRGQKRRGVRGQDAAEEEQAGGHERHEQRRVGRQRTRRLGADGPPRGRRERDVEARREDERGEEPHHADTCCAVGAGGASRPRTSGSSRRATSACPAALGWTVSISRKNSSAGMSGPFVRSSTGTPRSRAKSSIACWYGSGSDLPRVGSTRNAIGTFAPRARSWMRASVSR